MFFFVFFSRKFADASHSVGFLELDAEKVIYFIDDNLLNVSKEEHVFDAVIRWFHYKEDQREADLAKVRQYFLSETGLFQT